MGIERVKSPVGWLSVNGDKALALLCPLSQERTQSFGAGGPAGGWKVLGWEGEVHGQRLQSSL